jgi:hypothetical protein
MNVRILAIALLGTALAAPAAGAQTVPPKPAAAAKPAAVTTVTETKKGLLAQARIKPDSAMALARARVKGATMEAAEIEEEDGKLIYSFDMKVAGKDGIEEVTVDAKTGKVSQAHESGADVAKEKAADDKAAAAKAAAKKPPTKPPTA